MEHTRYYEDHPETAAELLAGAPDAAKSGRAKAAGWIGVARTLMNLEEFVTRE